MTEKDKADAAIRKAARELTRPLTVQLERCTKQIEVMAKKLEYAELENMRLREEIARLKKKL